MFGKNEIVGRSFFKDMPAGTLYVTSIFYTLQGEGPFMGHPAVFLRLGKCNLDCSFCDTYFDHGEVMTFEEIEVEIAKAIQDRILLSSENMVLVITGGEPMIQPNLPEFLETQVERWSDMQIETNGTQGAAVTQCAEIGAIIVVSPKCLEKDGKPVRYLKPDADALKNAYCLKFVVSADPDSPYHTIPNWATAWGQDYSNPIDIYISPMNVYLDQPREMKIAVTRGIPTLEERSTIIEKVSFWDDGILDRTRNRANHEYAAKYCMENGHRLNLQLHLYASIA